MGKKNVTGVYIQKLHYVECNPRGPEGGLWHDSGPGHGLHGPHRQDSDANQADPQGAPLKG